MSVLAVDLGGTWLRAAVVAADGSLEWVERRRLRSVFDGRPSQDVWTDVIDGIGAAIRHPSSATCRRIALAFPGPIAAGVPLAAPTLTGTYPVPADLTSRIAGHAGFEVSIVNDMAAAAAFLGSRSDEAAFFLITVSSGIGSRIFRRNATPAGVSYDGEIGHLVVETGPDTPLCDCGGRGHLGAISSGRAFERLARRAAQYDAGAFGNSHCAGLPSGELTNEDHLVPALKAGDPWAHALLRQVLAPLARLVLEVVVAAGLQRVYVIGGFAIALRDIYREALARELEVLIDSPAIRLDPYDLIRVVETGPEATLIGAALAAGAFLA